MNVLLSELFRLRLDNIFWAMMGDYNDSDSCCFVQRARGSDRHGDTLPGVAFFEPF